MKLLLTLLSVMVMAMMAVDGFQSSSIISTRRPSTASLSSTTNDDDNDNEKPKNFLDDLKGMFKNFDDVVDDFVYKRMGAGEQWYGKRKYNPSGRVDGDYNGMGRSDYFRIEVARVQKEEMELRKQRRLEEEAARKQQK